MTTARSVAITADAPTRNPLSHGYWKNHAAEWTSEILARIQATDQRFDGADGSPADGRISPAEVTATLSAGGTPPRVLPFQLLATYFNMATRRIDAATKVSSNTDVRLGLRTAGEVARYAIATLALPLDPNRARYSDAIAATEEINLNKSEIYG